MTTAAAEVTDLAISQMQLLTAGDVAIILQTTKDKVHGLVRDGKLVPTIALSSRQFRFSVAAVQRWIQAQDAAPQGVAGA